MSQSAVSVAPLPLPPIGRGAVWGVGALCCAVALLWAFPRFWYTRSDEGRKPVWLKETTTLPGWTYTEEPVGKAAESRLLADELFNGEFKNRDGRRVMAFGAKRYSEKPNDIGLFVHTPDRCWTEGGWKIEPVAPDYAEVNVNGVEMVFERRIFEADGQRELVYFGGLVGGQPLPYRLDHNLSVGMKQAMKIGASRTRGGGLRAADDRFWRRVWESFVNRRELLGPKQFIRISTPATADLAQADKTLVDFLQQWLQRADYQQELAAWRDRPAAEPSDKETK